jgi:hypothetical protein
MLAAPPPPELVFLASPLGETLTPLIALAALALILLWARRAGYRERWVAVLAGTGSALLVAGISLLAVYAGWWQGAFFQLPLLVLFAIHVPFSIAGYTLWVGLYRWLRQHARYSFLIYVGAMLVFIPIVLLVDPIQMSRNQFQMGGGYTVWIDAMVGQVVMLSPAVFYEIFHRCLMGVQVGARGA